MRRRLVRSPEAPKMTRTQGSPGGAEPRGCSPTVLRTWVALGIAGDPWVKGAGSGKSGPAPSGDPPAAGPVPGRGAPALLKHPTSRGAAVRADSRPRQEALT